MSMPPPPSDMRQPSYTPIKPQERPWKREDPEMDLKYGTADHTLK